MKVGTDVIYMLNISKTTTIIIIFATQILEYMKKKISTFIYLSILILAVSCQHASKKVEPILQQAESLLESQPDSALVLLDEIINPKSLKKIVVLRILSCTNTSQIQKLQRQLYTSYSQF